MHSDNSDGRKRKRRVVVVRRKPTEQQVHDQTNVKQHVIVARPIKPGQTICLNDPNHAVRMPSSIQTRLAKGKVKILPETLVQGGLSHGPSIDENGNILEHTLLGTVEEFRLEEKNAKGVPEEKVDNNTKGPSPVGRKGMVQRMRQEFRKARDIEKQIREDNLAKLDPSEARIETRKERLQRKCDARMRAWERTRLRMARKLGRDPDRMIMNTNDERRERTEEMNDLDRVALPVEKYGPAAWEMTLRNARTRVAHFGDYFSGLTLEIPINSKKVEYVRRSRYFLKKTKAEITKTKLGQSISNTLLFKASSKSWKDSHYLKERQRYMRRRIVKVRPFDPDVLGDIVIVGSDMFANLEPEPEPEPEDCSEDFKIESGDSDPLAEAKDEAEKEGPRILLQGGPSLNLVMRYPPIDGSLSEHVVRVSNVGSCPLRLTWIEKKKYSVAVSDFSIFNSSQAILPGGTMETLIKFTPSLPPKGLSMCSLSLRSEPALKDQEYTVTVKGIVMEADYSLRTRQRIHRKISGKVSSRFIRDMLSSLVTKVKPNIPEEKMRPVLFYRANRRHRFFYTPKVLKEFETLASDVLAAQTRLVRNNEIWDYSLDALRKWINQIPSRRQDLVAGFRSRCKALSNKAKIKPPPNPTSVKILNCLLKELARAIPKTIRDCTLENDIPLDIDPKLANPHLCLPPYNPNANPVEAKNKEKKERGKEENENRRNQSHETENSMTEEEKANELKEKAKMEELRAVETKQRAEVEAKKGRCRKVYTANIAKSLADVTRKWLMDYEDNEEAQRRLETESVSHASKLAYEIWWSGNKMTGGHMVPLFKSAANDIPPVLSAAGGEICAAILDDDTVYTWGEKCENEEPKEPKKQKEGKEKENNNGDEIVEESEEESTHIPLPSLALVERLWGMRLQQICVRNKDSIVGVDCFGRVVSATRVRMEDFESRQIFVEDVSEGLFEKNEEKEKDAEERTKEISRKNKKGAKKEQQGAKEENEDADPVSKIQTSEKISVKISSVAAASRTEVYFALDSSTGRLYSWGGGSCLGYDVRAPGLEANPSTPRRIAFSVDGQDAPSPRIVQISAGFDHAMAVDNEGKLWAWGAGEKFQLGLVGKKTRFVIQPSVVPLEAKVSMVKCGGDFTIALDTEGKVYTWGSGESGSLGNTEGENVANPTVVEALGDKKAVAVAAGANHALAITNEGVYSWGKGDSGALGHKNFEDQPVPQLIESLRGIKVFRIYAGGSHTIILGTEKPALVQERQKRKDEEHDSDACICGHGSPEPGINRVTKALRRNSCIVLSH